MLLALAALLTGCTPTPASVQIEGEEQVTVHATEAVVLPKATVLDANHTAIDPTPAVTWTVSPDSVAKIEGDKIVPVANGEATVTATVGTLKDEMKFVVAMPDKMEIAGYTPGDAWAVGEAKTLSAKILAGTTPVEGQTVTWTSDNATTVAINEKGEAQAIAAGPAKLTATAGALTATVDVTIGAAAPATADAAAHP